MVEEQPAKILVEAPAELEPLMPRFLANRQKDVDSIQTALREENFELIQRLGHSMRGAGAGYGFDYLTQLGTSLEEAAGQHHSATIQQLVQTMAAYLARVEVVFVED